jgi:hypothetical protein
LVASTSPSRRPTASASNDLAWVRVIAANLSLSNLNGQAYNVLGPVNSKQIRVNWLVVGV